MRWERRVVCMGEIRNTRKVVIGKSEQKKLYEDGGVDVTVILQRTLNEYRGVFIDLLHLAEGMGHCPAAVDMVTDSSSYVCSCVNNELTR